MFSFLDFKISLGITTDTNDSEYSAIMRGLIQELYGKYGIALTRDTLTESKTISVEYNTDIDLGVRNVQSISIEGFSLGVDYIIISDGVIQILSTGSMLSNTPYLVSVSYYSFLNESNEFTKLIYPRTTDLIYEVGINPYVIKSVSYAGNTLIENKDYYSYDGVIEFATAFTSIRTPFVLDLVVGWDTPPYDLKQAFYELVQIRYENRAAKSYMLSRIEGTSTTTYRPDFTPKHILSIFQRYSPFNSVFMV